MSGCVFCRIVAGDLPASFVHQDEHVVAFLDLKPVRPGHLLVVPRVHAVRVHELADPAPLWSTGMALAARLRSTGLADDVHFVLNDGPAATQTVPHVHLHLVPRRTGDGPRFAARLLLLPVAPVVPAARRADLDALADRLREAPG